MKDIVTQDKKKRGEGAPLFHTSLDINPEAGGNGRGYLDGGEEVLHRVDEPSGEALFC